MKLLIARYSAVQNLSNTIQKVHGEKETYQCKKEKYQGSFKLSCSAGHAVIIAHRKKDKTKNSLDGKAIFLKDF